MISPDDLPAAVLPAGSTDPGTSRTQLQIADAGMMLGERLIAAVPGGRHLGAALTHLVRAVQAAYTGMQPALAPATGPADDPVPYPVPATGPACPDPRGDPLPVDVALWRLGLQTSALHPLSRLAGLVLADACGPSGYIPDTAQPTLTQLSQRTGLGLHALHHHLTDLVTAGWISRHATTEHGSRRTRYQLRLPTPRTTDQ